MHKKNKLKAIVAIAVVMAFVTPVAGFANVDETSTLEVKRTSYGISLAGMDIARAKTKEFITSSDEPLPMDPVLTGYHPAIASDLSGNVVLGFEDDSPNVWFTASLDGGQTWNSNAAGWAIPEPPELPDVDSCGDGRFIGCMVPNYLQSYGSELYKVVISNPGLIPDGYDCPYWNWYELSDPNKHYYDFKSIAVGGYTADGPNENTWAFGGHSIVGTYENEGITLLEDIPLFSYQLQEAQGYAWIISWEGINECEITSMDIDHGNLYAYPVWNFNNTETGYMDIFVAVFDFGTWDDMQGYPWHPEIDSLTIETSGNDKYIDISALNDNIIVVSERDGDAVAYYSTNGMSSVDESSISTDASNPRIVHTDDNEAMCIFVKSGNGTVYYSQTEDGGATWSTPEELTSDSVAEDFQCADVCGFGVAYESDDTVYFEPLGGGPPPMPELEITSVSGGLGVSATVKNTGTAAATNATWSITVKGGLLGFINKTAEGTITSLAVDEESDPLNTGIFFGLGKIDIEVTATCDEGSSDSETAIGTQIIIFTMIS